MMGFRRLIVAGALVASGALLAGTASANSQTFVLVRATLGNTPDPDGGGLFQHEGGALQNSAGAAIGYYIVVRRVTTSGTATYNVADEKITLFFAPSSASALPETIVLQGVYSYNTGDFSGSVSAATNRYHYLIGAEGSGSISVGASTKLILQYLGTNPF